MAKLRRAISIERGAPTLTAEFADVIHVFKALLDPYRPELHYMRGPGPKWRAKQAAANAMDSVPNLVQAKA